MHHPLYVKTHVEEIIIHRLEVWIILYETDYIFGLVTAKECQPGVKLALYTIIMEFFQKNINWYEDKIL